MKKFISIFVCICVYLSLASTITANASQIGDVIGDVVYTDISTYINNVPIPSYAYDGGMVVIAEDLVNYGFDVTYNDNTRSLSITPALNKTSVVGMGTVYKNGRKLGQHYADALYTDIKTYFNGKEIPSYAINGYTMIKIESLSNPEYGIEFTWDDLSRTSRLWLDWAAIGDFAPLQENPDISDELKKNLIGEWSNGNSDYATGYTIYFYDDNSINVIGYRNKDNGTYSISEDGTIYANMKCNFFGAGSSGYTYTGDYSINFTFINGQLYQSIIGSPYSNITNGYLTKIK